MEPNTLYTGSSIVSNRIQNDYHAGDITRLPFYSRFDWFLSDCQTRRKAAILRLRRLSEGRDPDTGLPTC